MDSPYAEKVKELLDASGVFWMYEGAPRSEAPHARLHSGLHSDGYVDVGKMLKEQPEARKLVAGYMLESLRFNNFDRVVGADTSSTPLAAEVAKLAGARRIRMIKTEDACGKRQVWAPENEPLHSYEAVLQVEELVTTALSALQVREGIRVAYPNTNVCFYGVLPVVVERSDPDNRVVQVEHSTLLPLSSLDIRNYEPSICPYCLAGSEAIRPKEGGNWVRLKQAA